MMQASNTAQPFFLDARSVTVAFSGLVALREVNLKVIPGKVLGLIGPNGAGKTTLVNVMTGFIQPTHGQITLDGVELTGQSADKFRRFGIARTFQAGRLFRDLSVLDNLMVTAVALGLPRQRALRAGVEMLDLMGIADYGHRQAGSLPYTDERRVAIARALMCSPHYLLLDEPAAGMTDHEAGDLSQRVRSIASNLGCGVLLIEHNVRMVLNTCEHIVVLDCGQVIAEGNPEAIKDNETVKHAYMGTAADIPEGKGAVIV